MSYINFFSNGELRGYLLDQGLNIQQISLLQLIQELNKYAEQNGNTSGLKISNARIKKELGFSPTSTARHLIKLEKLGYIKINFDRTDPSNAKRIIKPAKIIKFNIESQINGIIGYINKILESIPDNFETLDINDQETRNKIKNAISHFGSDTKLINYINSNPEKIIDFYSVQDWLSEF